MKERIGKVAKYATVMADHYLSARQKLAIMEPFVSGDIPKLFDNSYGAHAHKTLSLTLVLDLIRDSCAIVLDEDERAPSIANVWRLVQAPEVRTALRSKVVDTTSAHTSFDLGFPEDQQQALAANWFAEDRAKRGQEFDEVYGRATQGVSRVLNSELAQKYRTARDKAIAHYEMRGGQKGPELFKLGDVGLSWGSPKEFFTMVDPVLWDVVLVATWGSYDVEGFDQMDRLYAADFWSRLQGKEPGPINHMD